MEKVNILLLMEQFIKEMSRMVKELGRVKLFMVMGHLGKEIFIKERLETVRDMGKENYFMPVDKLTKDILSIT